MLPSATTALRSAKPVVTHTRSRNPRSVNGLSTQPNRCFPSRNSPQKPRRPIWRRPALKTCDEDVLTDTESQFVEEWNGRTESDLERAVKIVSEAGRARQLPPTEVETAMLALEQASLEKEKVNVLPELEGTWDLVFSTATGIFKYVPVDEVAKIEGSKNMMTLVTNLGPFKFVLPGDFVWDASKNLMTFTFPKLQVSIFGLFEFERELPKKPKDYTFYYVDGHIACIRSKSKGVTLLFRE